MIENRIAKKQDVFADFKKAFDMVDRNLLWYKFQVRFGITGQFLGPLKALYTNVSCSICIDNNLTNWFEVNNGIKQGCTLSPTLFAMYIDDLEELNRKGLGIKCGDHCDVTSLLYADNSTNSWDRGQFARND